MCIRDRKNIQRFDGLYGPNGTSRHALPPPGFVRVPELLPDYPATRRVLIMEWLDGERVMSLVKSPSQRIGASGGGGSAGVPEECAGGVTGAADPWCEAAAEEAERERKRQSLPLIDLGIRCTLSQLIETGVMHADPHGGNLLRLEGSGDLAYLDFGLVSEVPPTVRDALVAAVALLVFSRDYEAVAGLFGELMLVPQDVIENEYQFQELVDSLQEAAEATLIFPSDVRAAGAAGELGTGSAVAAAAAASVGEGEEGEKVVGDDGEVFKNEKEKQRDAVLRERGRGIDAVPDVRFDQLLGALLALVPRFRFILPPYFLNNARALGTLEGMARSADPNFNILAVVYPFAVKRLLSNPSGSPVLRRVLRRLVSDERTGAMSLSRLGDMVDDVAALTGVPRNKIVKDALKSAEGVGLAVEAVMAAIRDCVSALKSLVSIVTGLRWLKRKWHQKMMALRDGTEDNAQAV